MTVFEKRSTNCCILIGGCYIALVNLTLDPKHEALKAQLLDTVQKAEEARRKLKVIEDYEQLMGTATNGVAPKAIASAEPKTENKAPNGDWSGYTASLAAALALNQIPGSAQIPKIFGVMKQHGNPVKNENVLRSILVRHSWFRKVRRGFFDLSEYGRKNLLEHIEGEKQKRAAST